MKKILEIILGFVCATAVFIGSAENPDGSCNLLWTLSCLAIAGFCGWLWSKLQPKPIHIDLEAYVDLQGQIQREIDAIEEDGTITREFIAELPDDAALYLTLEITSETSQSRFTDDAWGHTRSFVETNWYCGCHIIKVEVLDANGKSRESDFDEGNLDLEFETTDWK